MARLLTADRRSSSGVDRSIATEDEHAVKFTEACLRENMIRPDPVYLAAASHAAEILRGDR